MAESKTVSFSLDELQGLRVTDLKKTLKDLGESISGKKASLNAPDKVVKAAKRVEAFQYDIEAWAVLLREAQSQRIEEARRIYENLVTTFPSSGKYWKLYIEHEIKSRNYERVEKLFQRCLMKVLNIELWKTYLHYIKDTKGALPSYREKMAQAYDFALEKVGMDIASYQIWADYINFLKSVEAVGSYAENQRISAVRKVYQRGVVNPMTNVELLWNQYNSFEQSVNPLIAKKMQEDKGRDYMNARRVTKEYEVVTKGLNRNLPSVLPQNSPDEARQLELWRKYIAWEKANPLRTEDQTVITRRVLYAYDQCLLCMSHHADMWVEAASFLEQASKIILEKGDQNTSKVFADEVVSVYERAVNSFMKNNVLVHFAYADFEESRMKHEKVHSIYKKLTTNQDVEPTLPYIQYMKFARRAEGIKAARLVFKLAREDARITHHVYVMAALMEYFCSKDKTVAFKIFELGLKKFGQFPDYVLQYIEYMSHLNEDNNTRVLFERVLTSGQLEQNKSFEVWNKFLEFESTVGDLTSILKVEKRRAVVMGTAEFEGRETALLVDRYRFLDLFPCSAADLRAIGYRDLAKQSLAALPLNAATGGADTVKEVLVELAQDEESKFSLPDLGQMLPYKPQVNVPYGTHPIQGGVFPPPPVASLLLAKMPPPECFTGPFVQLDKLMEHIEALNVDELNQTIRCGPTAADAKQLDAGTRLSMEYAAGRKRRFTDNGAGDSGDEMEGVAPPSNDLYRLRQQKKAR